MNFFFLLLLLPGLFAGEPSAKSRLARRIGGGSTRIISGDQVTPRFRFESVAAIIKDGFPADQSKFGVICTGARISPRHVLTAAHCDTVRNTAAESPRHDLTVSAAGEGGGRALATRADQYPQWDRETITGDLAVMTLDSRDDSTSCMSMVADAELYLGRSTRTTGPQKRRLAIAGWGSTVAIAPGEEQSSFPDILRAAEVISRTTSECRQSTSAFDASAMICAGGESTKDSCQGDSGGSIFSRLGGGIFAIAGIASWGFGCGQQGRPAYYTNIATNQQYRSFIDGVVRASGDVGELTVSPTTATVSEGGRITVSVSRTSTGSSSAASVQMRLVSSSATVGFDVPFAEQTFSWAPFDTSTKVFTIQVAEDDYAEGDEVFYAHFGAAKGMYIPSDMSAVTVTIRSGGLLGQVDPNAGSFGPNEPKSLKLAMTGVDDPSPTPSGAANTSDDTADDDDEVAGFPKWAIVLVVVGAAIFVLVFIISCLCGKKKSTAVGPG